MINAFERAVRQLGDPRLRGVIWWSLALSLVLQAGIAWLAAHGHATIEATEPAESAWVAHVTDVASRTVYLTCNSWYLGANIPGKPRMFMPLLGFPPYADKCAEVARNGYEGFVLA